MADDELKVWRAEVLDILKRHWETTKRPPAISPLPGHVRPEFMLIPLCCAVHQTLAYEGQARKTDRNNKEAIEVIAFVLSRISDMDIDEKDLDVTDGILDLQAALERMMKEAIA